MGRGADLGYGWVTSNLGNDILLNSIGLMIAGVSVALAVVYFSLTLLLMVIYSAINIKYTPSIARQKLFKLLFFFSVMFVGGILPLFFIK
ncbi:MAG: hypothetical protein WC823_01575 [Parcubacteria group bacterium]